MMLSVEHIKGENMLTLEEYIRKHIDRYLKSRWKSASIHRSLEDMKFDDLHCIILDYMDYQDEWEDEVK